MFFGKYFGRAVAVLTMALAPWILFAVGVHAQNLPPPGAYKPIPNFTGVGAGVQFRQGINDRLSGTQPIAPTIVSLAFANLPTEQDGGLVYCTNCTKTNPCASGGSGALATGQNGIWTCTATGFSPSSNLNFNAHKVTNLASGTVNGDALAFGQNGAQLGASLQPFVRPGTTTCQTANTTSCTANRPAGVVTNDVLLFCAGMPVDTETVTAPAGFTQIRQDGGPGTHWVHNCFFKMATAGEPSTYTIGYSAPQFGFGVLMDLASVGPTPIDASVGGSTSGAFATSFSQSAPTTNNSRDLMIVCAAQIDPTTLTAPNPNIQLGALGDETCWSYASVPATATMTSATNFPWAGAQIAISPGSIQGAPALRDTAMQFASLAATSTPNYSSLQSPITGFDLNNCVNPVDSRYGADPTGANDSYAALDAASLDACSKSLPICLPAGTYTVCSQPWLQTCTSSAFNGSLPDVLGAGRNETTIKRCTGARSTMPVIVLAPPAVLSNCGGCGLTPPLVGSTGNSFNFGTGPDLFDLDEALGNRALNGLAAFTVEGFFSTTAAGTPQMIIGSLGAAAPVATGCAQFPSDGVTPPSCKGAFEVLWDSDSKLKARIRTTSGWVGGNLLKSAALSANTTYYFQLSFDGSNVRLYHAIPGAALTSDGKVAATGTLSQRVDEDLVLGDNVEYWHLEAPTDAFQGKMDSIRLSSTARCTNDAGGCTAPSAKLGGDSSTILLENWSNTHLPLVSPEFFPGNPGNSTPQDQPWMTMRNFGLGNPGVNQPHIKDLTITGGSFNLVADVTAPQLENIGFNGAQYGLMLDQINDYNSSGHNLYGGAMAPGAVLPMVVNGGLTPLYNLQFTCAAACIETAGSLISGAYFLPPSATKWAIISNGWLHLDSTSIDTENGGTFTDIQVSNMILPTGPWLEVDNSFLASERIAPIVLDGVATGPISIKDTIIFTGDGTGPEVDGTNGTIPNATVVFDNDGFNGGAYPGTGNSFVSGGLPYQVIGSGTRQQTTLAGTSAGNAVWSQPGQDSSSKKVVVFLNGYENTTATAQTITYPVAFANTPKITSDDSGGSTASTTTLTLPASMSATKTGWVIVEGY